MITPEQVVDVVHNLYGLSGRASPLGSCQDINYKFTATSEAGSPPAKFVVKFTNVVQCTLPEIEFQHAVITYLRTCKEISGISLPVPFAKGKNYLDTPWATDNDCISEVKIGDIHYFVRMLTYVEGTILSDFTYFSPEVLFSFGAFVATISKCLIEFETFLFSNPRLRAVANRDFEWDLRRADEVIGGLLPAFSKEMEHGTDQQRHWHDVLLNQYTVASRSLQQCLGADADGTNPRKVGEERLRVQILHGDLAHYNVVAQRSPNGRPYVSGVIDFGDSMCSWLVGELAVAIVSGFASDGANTQALEEACAVLKGFISVYPLNEYEIMALWPLVVLRSMVNILCARNELEKDPHNKYNIDGLAVEWRIFERISAVPMRFAQEAMRWTAGLPAALDTAAVTEVLRGKISMLESEGDKERVEVLDLSAESDLFVDGNWLKYHDDGALSRDQAAIRCVSDLVEKLSTTMPPPAAVMLYTCPYGVPQMQYANRDSLNEPRSVSLGLNVFLRMDTCRSSTLYLRAPFDCELLDVSQEGNEDGTLGQKWVVLKHPSGLSILMRGDFTLFSTEKHRILCAGEVFVSLANGAHFFLQVFSQPPPAHHQHHPQQVPERCTVHEFPVWSQFSPCPYALLGAVDPRVAADQHQHHHPGEGGVSLPAGCDSEELLRTEAVALRHEHVAAVQEHYFRQPPRIARAFRTHMYSPTGRGYLDMVNNVAVLGHCHPGVYAAATKQMRLLNTNSRFIYKQLGEFANQIIATMPENAPNLDAVFFVNSGSEATDLAMRLARTVATFHYKQRQLNAHPPGQGGQVDTALCRDVICLEGGYHGVTTASDEVSTSLNDNPNALESRPDWIHVVPMPNPFRGLYPYTDSSSTTATIAEEEEEDKEKEKEKTPACQKYADLVSAKIEELAGKGRFPACFIAEPLSGNAGGVELPFGYLQEVYKNVRKVGGLCISDEVQVGYGRLGTGFWGFPEHNVVPDILTMAKAAGNGHPLGFVVTSKENARIFGAESGSFFSSAGGGPVSCAIGSAVLEAVKTEHLTANAAAVGAHLNLRLKALAVKHSHIVGCIHGHGLYQGIELVRTASTATTHADFPNKVFTRGTLPATREAYAICERLLNLGVICHNTGDYSNVLKVKPPLSITLRDADFFLEALDICLRGW